MPPKRRRRFQGLYYHSSPPKVFPMNDMAQQNRKRREADDMSVKLSTIRIWMHEKDITKLTRILWAGQGNRLCQQASTNARMKRFLAAVPYVMNAIKEVHQAVIDNNLETLQAKLEPPVPQAMVTCKDANGLNIIHKAAGLGHTKILEYLIGIWPEGAHETDITGKTALHWAASAKNNMRCYTILTQAGCDEEAVDYKMKSPSYYRHKPHEIERAFLVFVPEAPRVSPEVTTDWDALSDELSDVKKTEAKVSPTNGLRNSATDDSIENTSEVDLHDGTSANEELSNEIVSGENEVAGNEDAVNAEENVETTNAAEPEEEAKSDEPTIENEVEIAKELDNNNAHDNAIENEEVKAADAKNEIEAVNESAAAAVAEDEEVLVADNEENTNTIVLNESAAVEGIEKNASENDIKAETAEVATADAQTEGATTSDVDKHASAEETPAAIIGEIAEEEKIKAMEDVKKTAEETANEVDKKEETEIKENANVTTEKAAADEETTVPDKDEVAAEDENVTEAAKIAAEETPNGTIDNKSVHANSETANDANDAAAQKPKTAKDQETGEDLNLHDVVEEADKGKIKAIIPNGSAKHAESATDKDDDDEDEADAVNGDAPDDLLVDGNDSDNEDEPVANNDDDADDTPTSSLAIEGFVQGDAEDNTVQSQIAAYYDEEARIQDIIASGDMEQLAQIVLNGDGNKLLSMQSKEPEIQAFLNNVPNYMAKIRRVHEAAREGSIMALQQALDRRKFAIAKDDMSPDGATPLHVAVLFGHTDIVRYLSARFPETTTQTDNKGRTALHYAATIKDNGHFYNMLLQNGANPKALDKFNHTPEFYLDNEKSQEILTYRELLSIFGAEELEEALLNDQVPDDMHSARRQLDDGDITRTLDRCFSVIQESSKVLSGVSASALAQRKPLSASTLQLSVTSYLSRFLKRSIYDKIKKRQTRLDHNLFDVVWPAMRKTSKTRQLEEDINCGVIAPDFDVYVVFQEFLVPLIKDMHCMSLMEEFKPHPRFAFFPMENGERLNTAGFVFEDDGNLIVSCMVECSRNLEQFELPVNLTLGQIEQAERLMMGKIFSSGFVDAIGETQSGSYYTLTEILEEPSEVRVMLTELGLMIPLLDTKDFVQAAECTAFEGNLWPYGRGVYLNSQQNIAIWLNCQEHLRVIATSDSKESGDIGSAYTRVGRVISYLETQLHFKQSYLLGYLQSRPSYLGTGLKLTTTLKLPNLMKEMDNLRHLCNVRGLHLVTNLPNKTTIRLINMQSMGVYEYVLFQDYCTAMTNILSLEKDMSLTNSKHIASMLVKIFRRQVENHGFETNQLFKTEQGKYLADTLADPLINALTEIANKRPSDPLAFLANYLQKYVNNTNNNNNVSTPNSTNHNEHINYINEKAHSSSSKTSSTAVVNSSPDRKSQLKASNFDDVELDGLSLHDDDDDIPNSSYDDRDEHGQSMLHFACARSHRRGGLKSIIEESKINLSYRDELYRTARDVSLQANQPLNAKEIDRYLLSIAVTGDLKYFEHLAIDGYDHIVDIVDDDGKSIIDITEERGFADLAEFLKNLRQLEETREELHHMIRSNNIQRIKELTAGPNAKWLLRAKNYYGRSALHIAILKESEEIVEHFVNMSPEILKIGDNLERTPLHYAMGTNAIESLSRILILKGAKRTSKDLKGRQPSYYFMNKADILRLQEEEDENR